MTLFSGLMGRARRAALRDTSWPGSDDYPDDGVAVPGGRQSSPSSAIDRRGMSHVSDARRGPAFPVGARGSAQPLSSRGRRARSGKPVAPASPKVRDPLGLSNIARMPMGAPYPALPAVPTGADGRLTPLGEAMCRSAIDEVIAWSKASGIANDTMMERRALERYVYGTGRPARLPSGVVDTIDAYVKKFPNSKGKDKDPAQPHDPPGSTRSQVNFGRYGQSASRSAYGDTGPVQFSPELDALLGTATVIFDQNGNAIGVEDDYDYTPGHRGHPVEEGTRLIDGKLIRNCGAVHPYHLYGGTGR